MLEGWPSQLRHSYNQTLTLAKARMDFGVNDAWVGHSSLLGLSTSGAPVRRSFTTSEKVKNLIETLFEWKSLKTDKRLFFMLKAHRTLSRTEDLKEEEKVV